VAWDKIACIFGDAILQNKTAEKASSNTVIILKILSGKYSFLRLKYVRMMFFSGELASQRSRFAFNANFIPVARVRIFSYILSSSLKELLLMCLL
jgi:hypothetical protein